MLKNSVFFIILSILAIHCITYNIAEKKNKFADWKKKAVSIFLLKKNKNKIIKNKNVEIKGVLL